MNWSNFSDGAIMSLIGYSIVFIALSFLFFIFSMLPKIIKSFTTKKLKKTSPKNAEILNEEDMEADVIAAISTVIHLYLNEQHDDESYNMTIKKITKRYSPWSSKIYAMNNLNKIH